MTASSAASRRPRAVDERSPDANRIQPGSPTESAVAAGDGEHIEAHGKETEFVTDTFVKWMSARTLSSSLMALPAETFKLFFVMCACADQEGVLRISMSSLAHQARISRDACERGLRELAAPDAESRDRAREGRRIVPVPEGWRILHSRKFRNSRTESQAKAAARQKRFYDKQRAAPLPSSRTRGEIE